MQVKLLDFGQTMKRMKKSIAATTLPLSSHPQTASQPKKHPPTLPETNIAPENRPLEQEIPIGNHHF